MNTDKIYAESVVNEYSVKTSSKVVALQKLDRWVKHPAKIVAVTFGLVSMILNCSGLAILIELFCFADIGQKLLGIVLYSFETVGCLSANEAYDAMYGGNLIDLIISDIMMPDIDGFEFAETIREQNQNIPILFMTARDDFTRLTQW